MELLKGLDYQELLKGPVLTNDGRNVCALMPSQVDSHGVWEKLADKKEGVTFWESPLPLLEMSVLLVFVLWQLFDFLFKKLNVRMPHFTLHLLVGLVIGQASYLSSSFSLDEIFPPNGYRQNIVETFSMFGFVMYWFLKGVKMDMGMISTTGKKATITGVASVLSPMIVSNIVFRKKVAQGSKYLTAKEYTIIIFIQSMTAFTGNAQLLWDLNITHSELGRIGLSSAIAGDITWICVNLLGQLILSKSTMNAVFRTMGVFGFVAVAFYVFRPAMFWVIRRTPEGRPVKEIYVFTILMSALLSLLYWKDIGHFPPLGSFVLGLAVPDGPPLGSTLVQRFESFNNGIILPIFVTSCMMHLDGLWLVRELKNVTVPESHVSETLSLVLLIFVAKFVASAIPPLVSRMPLKDSITLALILSHKGIVELSCYVFSVELQNIKKETFSIMVMFIMLNSLFLPVALKYLYDPSKKFTCYQRRNIMHLKPNSQLRMLVCIHKPDHITSTINFLEASCASNDTPLLCYVIHLVELEGKDNPIFISHQIQKTKMGSRSYSDNVIISFDQFRRNFRKSVAISTFTAISSAEHMHEDITLLALDKTISFILLPFHRSWSIDGSTIVSDENMIRTLNCEVLRRAPCSVGIIVDRQTIRETRTTNSPYQVCVIFIGGKDDQEALALAWRMSRNQRVRLTILHFIPLMKHGDTAGWEHLLDNEGLKDMIRDMNTAGKEEQVKYLEETVTDGSDTSKVLRSIAYDYDLFVVGRISGTYSDVTRGLGEWSEFEELGVIGDMLASPDFSTRATVLVVQQQQNVSYS